jgi:hypothetical protein
MMQDFFKLVGIFSVVLLLFVGLINFFRPDASENVSITAMEQSEKTTAKLIELAEKKDKTMENMAKDMMSKSGLSGGEIVLICFFGISGLIIIIALLSRPKVMEKVEIRYQMIGQNPVGIEIINRIADNPDPYHLEALAWMDEQNQSRSVEIPWNNQ